MEQQGLFGNFKYCEVCKRPLSLTYKDSQCPHCQEQQLFRDVKEYIRENDVTEYDVATHFSIPLYRVKGWIKEGRIEYKDQPSALVSNKCQKCGEKISFGALCPKCMKVLNTSGHSTTLSEDSSQMRFLENAHKQKHRK